MNMATHRSRLGWTAIAVVLALGIASVAMAGPRYAPTEVLVQFRTTTTAADAQATLANNGCRAVKHFPSIDYYLVAIDPGMNVPAAVRKLGAEPAVSRVQPDYAYERDLVPNDTLFDNQWWADGSYGVNATDAWDMNTGSSSVTIAVIDDGIDMSTSDLAGQLVGGYDFVHDDAVPDYDCPDDVNSHGTQVASVIASTGNNGFGLAGVGWDLSIMPLKVFEWVAAESACLAYTSTIIEAIDYAAAHGVRVTNNSYGYNGSFNQALYDAIADAASTADSLFVAAAGNDGKDNDNTTHHYPSDFTHDAVLSVAATSTSGDLAVFSNYGAVSIDLGAPGVSIPAFGNGDNWSAVDGTSFSAPLVAGVAGLLLSGDPSLTYQELRAAILNNVTQDEELDGYVVTGGRLNASAALATIACTGGCFISDTCYADGEEKPGDPCEYCDAAEDPTDWTDRPSGTSCADEDWCDGEEVCNSFGMCVNQPNPCDSQCQTCHEDTDTCEDVTGTCSDGLFCTENDYCDAGACQSGPDSPCDPGVQCLENADTCQFPWELTGSLDSSPNGAADAVRSLLVLDDSIYAGTAEHGDVYMSVDGGDNWTYQGGVDGADFVYQLVYDTTRATILSSGPYGAGYVWGSTNEGTEWDPIGAVFGDPTHEAIKIAAHSSGALVAGTHDDTTLYRLASGDTAWSPQTISYCEAVGAIFEDHTGALYLGCTRSNTSQVHTYRSVDAGVTWNETAQLVSSGLYKTYRVFDFVETTDEQYVLASAARYWLADGYPLVFRTSDGGESWESLGSVSSSSGDTDYGWSLLASPSGAIYYGLGGTSGAGVVLKSSDNGSNWTQLGSLQEGEEKASSVYDLVQDSDGYLYAATKPEGRVFRTCDGCDVDNTCYYDGQGNPGNVCEVCDFAQALDDWSADTSATDCDDGQFCTLTSQCDSRNCGATSARDCGAGLYCDDAADECVASAGKQSWAWATATDWANSGVTVVATQQLTIRATGVVFVTDGGDAAGPDGLGECPACVLPTANRGALIGRIQGMATAGEPFLVGASFDAEAAETGVLHLLVNDETGAYDDNAGVLSVEVQLEDAETPVDLISFEAEADESSVLLTWETASERDMAGFHLLRSTTETGAYVRITGSLIPAEGDAFTGASYEFVDDGVTDGTYYYKLEAIDLTGASEFFGPVDATVESEPRFGCGN